MKKTYLILSLTLNFGFGLLFGQKLKELPQETSNLLISIPVSKTEFVDNSAFPVKLSKAQYDVKKSNMPYFLESKIISKNNLAKADLINVKTIVLSGEVSQKLTTLYRAYLTSEFSIEIQYAQSARDHMVYSKIMPYRINSENQIEELLTYNVEWTTAESDISSQKTKSATTFSNNSVLATGNWYKIGITKSGIYKLDKTFLKDRFGMSSRLTCLSILVSISNIASSPSPRIM